MANGLVYKYVKQNYPQLSPDFKLEFVTCKLSLEDVVDSNVPKLSQNKKLYYSISRLTFDKAAKPNQIKGFVVNPRKDDVNTFNFETGDESGISSHFVTNYLWDLIAAGAAPEWDQV